MLYENKMLNISYEDEFTSFVVDGDLSSNVNTFDVDFVVDDEVRME